MFPFFAEISNPCAMSIFCPRACSINPFLCCFSICCMSIFFSIPFSAQKPQDRQSTTLASGATS
ncbi:unnamed protein product [Meloidogyne enterolobii]|uniref:Uncharacterized protein n=1 Tax=Meloidogyne enterolobii TaxID=390850 RepID=A0ACB0ZUN4_MELEN